MHVRFTRPKLRLSADCLAMEVPSGILAPLPLPHPEISFLLIKRLPMMCTCCGSNRWRASVYQAPQRSSYIYPWRHYQHHRQPVAPMATTLRRYVGCTWGQRDRVWGQTGGFTRIRDLTRRRYVCVHRRRWAERQHTPHRQRGETIFPEITMSHYAKCHRVPRWRMLAQLSQFL